MSHVIPKMTGSVAVLFTYVHISYISVKHPSGKKITFGDFNVEEEVEAEQNSTAKNGYVIFHSLIKFLEINQTHERFIEE